MVDSKMMMALSRQLRWTVLFSLLLWAGGCSNATNFKGFNRSSLNQSSGEAGEAKSTAGQDAEQVQADLEHGQRLSTLERDLPPGRLPPDILPATTDTQRIPQIQPGRQDPFSSLPTRPILVQRAASSINSAPISPATTNPTATNPTPTPQRSVQVPATPQSVVPVPITAQLPTVPRVNSGGQALTPAPTPQAPASGARLIPVPPAPVVPSTTAGATTSAPHSSVPAVPPAPTPAPQIAFSGVVQVGDRVNIIVEEPSGSRYVTVGATVGNGRYVIKAVDFARGATPAVILDRGGVESVHWVGEPVAFSPRP